MNLRFLQFLLPPKTNLTADLIDAINSQQKVVIQKRLDAIAKDFEAQGSLAQLQYLQSIDLSHEKTISPES